MTYKQEVDFFVCQVDEMVATFKAKRQDYGPSTTETWEKFGPVSMLTRMHDKLNRLDNVAMKPAAVKDESVRDTLLDLANYCIIMLLEYEKEREKTKVCEVNK